MTITTHRETSRHLTIFTCKGNLSYTEIIEAMKRFYKGIVAPPTKKVLWDISSASVSSITAAQVTKIADLSIENEDVMTGGKTAVVAPEDVDFGLARSFAAQTIGERRDFMVFRTNDEAAEWLE